jgi:hypothetical protein
MLARRKSNRHLNNHQLISGRRISIQHLLLTSTSAILFGFSSGLDIIKCQHSSKPDALAVILMKHLSIITVSILTISLSAFSQDKDDWLVKKIKSADTILLVSHEVTAGVTIVDDSTGKQLPLPKLTIAGKPNYQIIKEQQVITGLQLDTLIKILDRPFQDTKVEVGKCFMPHHAILLIKKSKTSYIDICFGCRRFDTSKDLKQLYEFDNRKWTELENLFLRLGFKYELAATE